MLREVNLLDHVSITYTKNELFLVELFDFYTILATKLHFFILIAAFLKINMYFYTGI